MPGFFGGSCKSSDQLESLARHFCEIWPDASVRTGHQWVIGAHSFRNAHPLAISEQGIAAVDGDASLTARESGLHQASMEVMPDRSNWRAPGRCNVATLNPATGEWTLRVDWSGAFPLYLACIDEDVFFSSHLRPLARCIRANADTVGCLWFLREGAISGRRSFYEGIQRLDAGDVVTWGGSCRSVRIDNASTLWTEAGKLGVDNDRLLDALTGRLAVAVADTFGNSVQPALMVSGGWDSRTLAAFASTRAIDPPVLAYSHGDLGSRELRISKEVAAHCGLPFVSGSLDPSMFDLAALSEGFASTENVVFPHWHAAGRRLNAMGVDVVAAGIFGEVLGGHYGSAMVLPGLKKVRAVLGAVLGWRLPDGGLAADSIERLTQLFAPTTLKRPWYAAELWWPDSAQLAQQLREDTRQDLRALIARGVQRTDQLIEAYITQRRAAHYIAAQLLSCRAVMDIGIPFIDRELLIRASSLPLHTKIHNRLNREILASTKRDLLDIPLAATLVSAGAPILAREASRWMRRNLENRAWRRHFESGGSTAPPRFAWANFEFVRSSRCLEPIADDLRLPMWDRGAIAGKLKELATAGWDRPAHPLVDMLMKIYTVDLMLR